ncbi:MAG TPA: HEPN domain-containing protein [Solirubrobacteraceae bacterium]|jgi:HEPN domain-containing protein
MATNGDLARRLLGAAREDELAARSVLRVAGIADPIVGFHTQQAVEKAIKAVLAARGTEFPFTHDLKQLRDFAEKSGIELPSTLDDIEDLTPFSAAERYGSEAPLGLDRDQALKWAAAAIAWAHAIVTPAE